jgi:hypothetical protein
MDEIIALIPAHLQLWVKGLTVEDIAHILTIVGSASVSVSGCNVLEKEVLPSANIGLAGENEVQKILQDRYTIINTAKSGKCGDFVIVVNGVRILIEVKKHSKTVPSIEIDKFYRDIDSNASISGAIMISLTSKIVGINRSMEYTHHYVNGSVVPIIFLSLKDIVDHAIAKECLYSAIDILLTESNSKNTCIDIGDNIIHAINNIDQNLDLMSQCRLMIHETQSMFNKQLGRLMHQVLSAEINIKNSIRLLKSEVDVIHFEDEKYTVQETLANLKVDISIDDYNMLLKILEGHSIVISKTGNMIQTKDKKISIKVSKSSIKISITMELTESLVIDGVWSYNGKVFTITLTAKTLQTVIYLMR